MANFEFEIHRLTPGPKKYNVLKTKMEGTRVKRRLKSTLPQRRWEIEIRGRTNSEKDLIVAHWDANYDMYPFNWVLPTSWGGQTYYVTYEEFSYANPPSLYNVWEFQITFLEELV